MKKTILFISGWAHGAEAVQPMADALADDFGVRILTGNEVLKNRSVPDADCIVAGSMGGILAMELLPASCKKLVLVSSTAKFCAAEGYACGTSEKVLRRMIAQLKRDPEAVLEEFFKNVHLPQRESRRAIAQRQASAPDPDALVAGLEYLLRSDVRDRVPRIDIPVLLLHGAEDRIIPATAAEWLRAHLPGSALKIVGNAGHALPAHRFETVMKAMAAFLGE